MTTIAGIERVSTGPTWQKGHDGKFLSPQHTLGWDVLKWSTEWLLQPDGPNAGEPWEFTPEQARFVMWFYAIDQEGKFTYRYSMFRRMKGFGKDPLGAALSCAEFIGPCRFGGWNKDGTPIVKPHSAAWVQIAAVSRDQTRNTMTLFPGMISPQAQEEYKVDMGKEIIYAHQGRCRIEAVTSSPRALEGQRSTFILKNETHLWRQNNEGHAMSAVIARNAAKARDGSSRVLAISNAHAPGEDSDAERDYETYRKGVKGMLYDSLESPAGIDIDNDDELIAALDAARGDSDWINPDRLLEEIRDPRTSESIARRFYLNQIWATEDRPFDLDAWAAGAQPDYMPEAGALIALGFDGSRGEDATAIVATEISTGFQWLAGLWEKPLNRPDWEVPRDEVDSTMRLLFSTYEVWRLTADYSGWDETCRRWEGEYGKNRENQPRVVAFSMESDVTQAHMIMAYDSAIRGAELTHSGDPRYTRHVGNAIKKPITRLDEDGFPLWRIYKERWDSPNKIDAAMAGGMSWDGRLRAIAANASSGTSIYESRGLITL